MKRLLMVSGGMILLLALSACSLPSQTQIPTEVPSSPPIVPVTGVTPSATAIQHQTVPIDLPEDRVNHAGDHDSSKTADQNRAPGGDRFTYGVFERPFNADTMDEYYPYLDIQEVYAFVDETWVYAVIVVKGRDANKALPGNYAFELDFNLDGRGDWFVVASNPSSTDWTTDGVQVWADKNGDVGGKKLAFADPAPGDGYETLLFDQGQGDDPDLAWARISPVDPNAIQIALKQSLLAGDTAFMIGMWTGGDDLNPALFDLNDHFTHEQAGASLKELEFFYPIKALSALDNTCRMSVGFQPTGVEPGGCQTTVTTTGEEGGCTLSCPVGTGWVLDPVSCQCVPYIIP